MTKLSRFDGVLLLMFLAVTALYGVNLPKTADEIPVQDNGRVLPLASFAREALINVVGKQSLNGEKPSVTIFRWMSDPEAASNEKLFTIGFEPLRDELKLDKSKSKLSLNEINRLPMLRMLASQAASLRNQKGKPTKTMGEAEQVLEKSWYLEQLINLQMPRWNPDPANPAGEWARIAIADEQDSTTAASDVDQAFLNVLHAYHSNDETTLGQWASTLNRLIVSRWNPDADQLKAFRTEVSYDRLKPIAWAARLYMVALILLLATLIGWSKPLTNIATVLVSGGLALHIFGMVQRTIIAGRAPWSNFYESMITIAVVLVLIGLLFARKRLRSVILAGCTLSGWLVIFIADETGFSPGVHKLMPALQSYWLTIHVIVIISGYAAAAVSMVLGHISLGMEAFRRDEPVMFADSTKALYRSVQLAMLLLFAGTMLGAVWAHEAWGRYWGWDPKETWALISWLGYLAVAHSYFAGWLKARGLALAAIGVFPLILMTYYGVNYLLSGLHSYAGGESKGVPPLMYLFLAVEAFIIIAASQGWHIMLADRFKHATPSRAR